MQLISKRAPARPAAGSAEVFLDQVTGKLSVVKPDGTIVSLEDASSPAPAPDPESSDWLRFDPTAADIVTTDPQSITADAAWSMTQSTSETFFEIPDIVSHTDRSTRNSARFLKRLYTPENVNLTMSDCFQLILCLQIETHPPSMSDDVEVYVGFSENSSASYRYVVGGFLWDYGSGPRFRWTCGGDTNYVWQSGARGNAYGLIMRHSFLRNDPASGYGSYLKNTGVGFFKSDGVAEAYRAQNVNDDYYWGVPHVGLWVGRKSTAGGDSSCGVRMYYRLDVLKNGYEPTG